jgi:diguanylate cyclase
MREFKLFPETDARQAHRMLRYLMAASTSFMVLLLLCLMAWQGFLEWDVLSHAGIAITLLVIAFYVAFRTGLNERFSDPSLTVPMILAATSVLAYVVYNADQARGVFMLLYLLPFLFGVFRLSTGVLLNLTLFTIVLYLLVMLGIWHYRGEAFDFRLEVVQWLVLCVVLTWFSFMGGYISRLRRNLAASNVRLETAFRTIQEMSVRDELTGTYNRRYLMQLLVQEKNRIDRGGRGMAVCILDLDHFKSINDSYGHLAGDAVLRVVTAEAQAGLRTSDFFGRYGGEEFLMILTQTTLDGARVIADRFRRRMEALGFPEIDPQLGITTSIGIAEYIGGEDVVQTLARADAALYRAKHLGRNRVELAENRPAYEGAAQN